MFRHRRYDHNSFFGKLQCTQYMTTKNDGQNRMAGRAVRYFRSDPEVPPYWTPSGKVKFTPIVIKNRKHKINYPFETGRNHGRCNCLSL